MNLQTVRQRIKLENRRMQMENMQRQAMAGWDANYHLVSDFTNADNSNKWAEISSTVYAAASLVLAIVSVGIFMGVVL
jgi:hypothetical protein